MAKTYEIRLGHKTGLAVVSPTQRGYVSTLYWFPDRRILRAPDDAGTLGVLQQQHEYGTTEVEALENLRVWATEHFSSVGNYCEGREQ